MARLYRRPRYRSGPKRGQFKPRSRIHARHNPTTNPRRRRRRAQRNPVLSSSYGSKRVKFFYGKPKSKAAQEHARGLARRASAASSSPAEKKRAVAELARMYGARRTGHRSKRRWSARTHRWVGSKKSAPRRKTVAKRRKSRKSTRSRKSSKRSRAARLGWQRKRARGGRKVSRRRRRRAAAPRRTHRRRTHRRTHRTVRRIRRRRTTRRMGRRGISFYAHPKRGSRRWRRYTTKARYGMIGKRRGVRFITARRNPDLKSALLSGAALYGGFLGMRALAVVLKENVISKISALSPLGKTGYAAKAMACIPAAAAFGVSMFAGKFIKNPSVLAGVQAGGTLVLLDAIFTQFVLPNLGSASKYFQPMSGYGYFGYGGEYIRQRTPLPYQGYGAVAREAVAEYVQQPGMGAYDVNEALADSEVRAMQTGYAAGSLAKTLFSS